MTASQEMAPHGDGSAMLAAFRQALAREIHVLRRDPRLLWQQLFNRLQWEDEPVPVLLEPEFERRSVPGAAPWFRTRTRFRESEALVRTVEGHNNRVTACAFSPDGTQVVSAGLNNTLRVWDAETGQEIRTLEGHRGGVQACAFSPDGTRVVSASGAVGKSFDLWNTGTGGGVLKIWDAATGAELRTLEGHCEGIHACAFSPDGTRVVSGGADRTVRVWDTETGQLLQALEGHYRDVRACAFSPDAARVVSASLDRTIRLWDATSGQELRTLDGHTHGVTACAFSPDGSRILSGSFDQTVRLWDATSGQEVRRLEGQTEKIYTCAVSPDGARVVAGLGNTLKLWGTETGQVIQALEGHTDSVRACAYSPDGFRVVSGSDDETLKLWDAGIRQEIRSFENGHVAEDEPTPQSRDGEQKVSKAWVHSPDGTRAVSVDWRTLKLWDTQTERELHSLEGHRTRVNDWAFSPDGLRLVSAGDDGTVRLWDVETGEELHTLQGHVDQVLACAFSPDGTRVVSGSWDETVRIWDAGRGTAVRTLVGHTSKVYACVYSPDGGRLLSIGNETLKLWDTETGQELHNLEGHTRPIAAGAFSPDGLLVASTSSDRTLKLWDTQIGECLATLPLSEPGRLVTFDPARASLRCRDGGGSAFTVEFAGVPLGPLIVTPVDLGDGPALRCPVCFELHPLQEAWLGQELECPGEACTARLRVNPFVVRHTALRRTPPGP